jgi:hypothetical protein
MDKLTKEHQWLSGIYAGGHAQCIVVIATNSNSRKFPMKLWCWVVWHLYGKWPLGVEYFVSYAPLELSLREA